MVAVVAKKGMQSPVLAWVLFALMTGTTWAAEKQTRLVVAAGEFDRHSTLTTVNLPRTVKGEGWELQDGKESLPLQVGSDGRAMFILRELKKGAQARYTLMNNSKAPASRPASVS